MNTLFEKFKNYELTKEQTAKVRGGTTTCTVYLSDGTAITGISGISDPTEALLALHNQLMAIDEAAGAGGGFYDGKNPDDECVVS